MDDPAHQPARPYPHQVGGHGQLAMTNTGRLLKPSSKKEHAFYNYIYSDSLPQDLIWIRQITPKYYGEAEFPKLSHPTSNPMPVHTLPPLHPHNHPPSPPFRIRSPPRSASSHALPTLQHHPPATPVRPDRPSDRFQPPPPPSPHAHAPVARPVIPRAASAPEGAIMLWRTTNGTTETSASISPWALRMRSRVQSTSNPAKKPHLSIALEDINRLFKLPCVMDCKIGTRHYDDDASEEKRRRHIAKANATTSARCGVRYTGMQSFKRTRPYLEGEHPAFDPDEPEGVFEFRDKYHGRSLKEADLIPEATWFFHDNCTVRTTCVKLILDKLRNLRRLLIEQHHFYFYSSSLLLVYEGALPHIAPARVDVRMIDFAHTVLSKGHRDDGYVHGIDYLIQILTQILENEDNANTTLPKTSPKTPTDAATYEAPSVLAHTHHESDSSATNGNSVDHVQESPP